MNKPLSAAQMNKTVGFKVKMLKDFSTSAVLKKESAGYQDFMQKRKMKLHKTWGYLQHENS